MGEAAKMEGWIAQMQAYFTMTCTSNERQRIAQVGLCVGGEVLTWWEKAQFEYTTWQAMANAMRHDYGDHYAKDNAYREITNLRMTGTVQSYLTQIQRLNHLAGIDDLQLIRIILNGIPTHLRQSMAHYESLRSQPAEWRKKLIEMDVATAHYRHKEPSGKKEGGKKRLLDDRIHLPEDRRRQRNTERGDHIHKEQWNRRREEGRCMRCGKKKIGRASCRERVLNLV